MSASLPSALATARVRGKVECQYYRRGDEQEEQRTIINISTSATQFHQPGMSAYGASKEALAHLLGYGQTEDGSHGVQVRNLHLMRNYTDLLEDQKTMVWRTDSGLGTCVTDFSLSPAMALSALS